KMFMRRLGYDVDFYHREGRLIFLDCYSPRIGLESEEEHSEDPFNFPNLAMTLAGIIRELDVEPGELIVIIHSLTTIMEGSEFRPALEFYRNISGKLGSLGAITVAHLNRAAFPAAVIAAVEDVADGVIELKIEESPEGIQYYMRCPKMILMRHETRWKPYRIEVEKGLTL
ncbi:MAG: ATPase domain-containing protein, partial [Candidatus Bathyarchaeia archaeon]